jgi:propanol-preferring alcohol dehydrogenase
MVTMQIPQTQTVALVSELGGKVEFDDNYPVPVPGQNEVLAKVLYTGVCQSGKFTQYQYQNQLEPFS